MEPNTEIKGPNGTLLLEYVSGSVGDAGRREVEEWLAQDAANGEILMLVARIYHAQRTAGRISERDPHEALRKVRKRIERKSRQMYIFRAAVAASLIAAAAGIGSHIWQSANREVQPQFITVTTEAGERSQLTLPDGTAVHLNAGSTLTYPSRYDRNERLVRLSGEAYFDVAKIDGHPFRVSVRDDMMYVKVLGTEFNLRAYERDSLVQTTLAEGSIQLGVRGKERTITMIPNEKATYNVRTTRICLEKINSEQESSWKDGVLIFRDTPMPEVLRRLAHFYSVEFDIRDAVIREYVFTGTFEDKALSQILDYMKISSRIDHSTTYPENPEEGKPVIRLTRSGI